MTVLTILGSNWRLIDGYRDQYAQQQQTRVRYLGVQALQVGADVLNAGSKRVHMQERGDDPWNKKAKPKRGQAKMYDSISPSLLLQPLQH